jgi:hypothetical protein
MNSPPPKKRIQHFLIPKNIHPFTAVELAILRSRDQLYIARILRSEQMIEIKDQMEESRREHSGSRNLKIGTVPKKDELKNKIRNQFRNV